MMTSDVNVGDRVLVSEIYSPYSQKRNLYNQLMWTKTHMLLVGHVGVMSTLDEAKCIGNVKFFISVNSQLKEIYCDWPLDSLENARNVYFDAGESVVLTKGSDKVVMAKITNVEMGEQDDDASANIKYNVELNDTTNITIDSMDYSTESHRNAYICPIYTGSKLTQVLNESGTSARSFKNTIHGYATESLMSIISNWRDEAQCYARFVESIRANPEQVRQAVDGELPLFRAVSDDNWNLVVMLLALGANKYARDEMNRTIIHVAAQRGLDQMLEGVLSLLPKDVNRTTREGDTPLHLAARNTHAACIDRLLAVPTCQSSVQNENGDTPLHELCTLAESANKKAAISRLLTNSRASIHQPNNNNMSPLQIAILKGHVGTVEQLIQLRRPHRGAISRNSIMPLHFAAIVADVNVINTLIMLGMDVHRKDRVGRSVLHYAVEKWTGQADKDTARLAAIQSLVNSGAPTNAVDVNGQTVLHVLVKEMGKQEFAGNLIPICVQLVKTNLNLDEMASRLRPQWQLATACFLIANGADVNIKDRKGVTAAELATDATLRQIFMHISCVKIRSCLPMVAFNRSMTFDSVEVTMCTFMCQDSIANVQFIPCGHRVTCVDCAQKTAFRRCPLCYHIISSAKDDAGNEVIIGCKSSESPIDKSDAITEQLKKKIAEEAAREAKMAVEKEKQKELRALRERLEQLEMETSCAICMDAKIAIVFNCGHTACSDCAAKLKLCHICRKTIESTQNMYS